MPVAIPGRGRGWFVRKPAEYVQVRGFRMMGPPLEANTDAVELRLPSGRFDLGALPSPRSLALLAARTAWCNGEPLMLPTRLASLQLSGGRR